MNSEEATDSGKEQERCDNIGYIYILLIFAFLTGHTNNRLDILDNLCTDIILCTDFQEQHKSIVIEYGGSKPTLTFCALTTLNVEPPMLFANLSEDSRPIATKSCKFSKPDQQFIDSETSRLLAEGIIEPSTSRWRAQPLVVREDRNH